MLRFHKYIFSAFLVVVAMTLAAAAAEPAAEQEVSSLPFADWGYVLRGVLFIFASAMAMVWIGRRISKRRK